MINLAGLVDQFRLRDPAAPALIDPNRSAALTFGDLGRRAEELAIALRTVHGVQPGTVVAAIAQNSSELIELYLACARAGAVLFPLNWRFSAAQVAEVIEQAHPAVVFHDHGFRDVVDEVRGKFDCAWVEWDAGRSSSSAYEDLLDSVRGRVEMLRPDLPDRGSLTYAPYLAVSTGGTTGIPKNAVHSQFSYGACTIDYQAAARIAETDVYLMLGQLFHVVGYMTLAYLVAGRPVVVANFDSEPMLEIIRQENVSGFFAVATMLPRLLAALEKDGAPVPSVRLVEYGGAPMGQDVIRRAAELFGCDLMQAWGMSEFGPGTYLGPEAHRRALRGERPDLLRSCGRPALLSEVAILDEDDRPVPRDRTTMGELCHRGPNTMLEYWNKPEETAELLRGGWLRTGDGAVWDDEGYVYIVDRIKSMIISGGENIFPSEVERCLADHPDIAEVVVIGVPDPHWGEVVKAVVVRKPGAGLQSDDVREFVSRRLASYKKPRLVEFIDRLPVTPTGKVDRKQLRESTQPT